MTNYNYRKRHVDWNYGGSKWKLSRSKIDLFMQCPKCFYMDNKLGLARPKFPPFNLNSAVDNLFKNEFDIYRKEGKAHPIMIEYKIDSVPFQHKELNDWRENFVGIQVPHESTGMIISGAVDDIWINKRGELQVVDYKSTSKEGEITLDEEWKEGYKRQLEVYQWLLRQKGFDVSEKAYIVYANGLMNENRFDNMLKFDTTVLEHIGVSDWVEETIFAIKELLDSDKIPEKSPDCDHCAFVEFRESL